MPDFSKNIMHNALTEKFAIWNIGSFVSAQNAKGAATSSMA